MKSSYLISRLCFNYDFRFPQFSGWLTDFAVSFNPEGILIPTIPEDMLVDPEVCGNSFPYQESQYLLNTISSMILKSDSAIFHGVAIKIGDNGYIITAPSGTGKSTQYRNLKKLYKDSIQILNGDKPVLDFYNQNKIQICPSPWKGKEGYYSNLKSNLKGIVVLKQSDSNSIRLLEKNEAIILILCRFLCVPDQVDKIKMLGHMTELILHSCPIWLMENLGDYDSSRLLYDTLIKYEGNSNV